jgi:F0F1-type ATP synthase assembly protein I
MLELIFFRVTVFTVIFIVVGFLLGVLASFRPVFRKKINQEEEKRTKSIQRTEYLR